MHKTEKWRDLNLQHNIRQLQTQLRLLSAKKYSKINRLGESMKAYKLFRVKNGKLYPLYIYSNEELPMNELLHAKCGEITNDGKHVKSKLGDLALRPGFHSCDCPYAGHIGKKMPDGSLAQAKDTVWAEIEVSDEVDYNALALQRGTNVNGKVIPVKCCLDIIPENGFYYFQTSKMAKARWIISGEITINRILSNEDVRKLCREYGLEPQPLEVA